MTARDQRRGVAGAVERHPLVTFFALAFPLSWAIVPFTGPEAINPTGPFLAAHIVGAVLAGRRGVGAWLRRSFTPRGPWHCRGPAAASPW